MTTVEVKVDLIYLKTRGQSTENDTPDHTAQLRADKVLTFATGRSPDAFDPSTALSLVKTGR